MIEIFYLHMFHGLNEESFITLKINKNDIVGQYNSYLVLVDR